MSAPHKMTAIESGTHQGVEWAIVQAPMFGAINGYVRIPKGHPWRDKDYDDIPVDCPGGLTYAGRDGWVGFDTLHSGDMWPEVPRYGEDPEWAVYWTQRMVVDETIALAGRIAAASDRDPAVTAWGEAVRHD